MEIINLSTQNSILGRFVSEIRDVNIQNDRLRFRKNLERIGEIMSYEISKTLTFAEHDVQTPLGIAPSFYIRMNWLSELFYVPDLGFIMVS